MTNRMEWQPIETAPKDREIEVLLFGRWAGETNSPSLHPVTTVGFWNGGNADWVGDDWWEVSISDGYAAWIQATHWAPLPESPLVDHPRPTTPVVDHEGGGSERQDKRISELEAEVAKWKAGVELEGRQSAELEAEVERLKGAVKAERDACAELAKEQYDYCRSRKESAGVSCTDNFWGGCADTASIIHRHIRARSTAMNKGGE